MDISKLDVLYFILYLPLNPLPYLGHPMRECFLFNLFDLDLVNKIPHVLGEIPQKLGMPSAFLLSQLASLQSFVAVRFSCRAIVGRCGEFFAERGVPWKPWNLSGSATVIPHRSSGSLPRGHRVEAPTIQL